MPDMEPMNDRPARRWSIGVVAVALFVSALLMLGSMLFFRADKPVFWPPLSRALYALAYAVFGTLVLGVLYLAMYLLVHLISVIARKGSWKDLLSRVLSTAIAVTIVLATASVCLKAFYWPWAVASALMTVDSSPPKWRLEVSARVLAGQWDETLARRMLRGMKSGSPGDQAACSYVLAAAGEKKALEHLVEIAVTFPADNNIGVGSVSAENGITGRGDVVWLMNTLGDFRGRTPEEIAGILADEPKRVEWDRKAGKYVVRY